MTAAPPSECARCVLRVEDDHEIQFDGQGLCNHCRHYDASIRSRSGPGDPGKLERLLGRIREEGRGRPYDCVVGLSGGVDSSYLLYLACRHGLRPLVVHLDNGWDTELAVSNIESLVKRLGVDLYTHVISWGEFRDLQLAYFHASVVDIEAITDHAIAACLYRAAAAHGIRTILSGANLATEGFLPPGWVHNKNDLMNIRSIHRAYGTVPLRTFPTLGVLRLLWYSRVRGIRSIPLLDHVPYVKEEAKRVLAEKLGWRDYGGKHHESVFTRFYQACILPGKFGIDKRRSHLSTLICAGQMTREEALRELARPPYDPAQLAVEREFVLKKLGLDEAAFRTFMASPPRSHMEFGSHLKVLRTLRPLVRLYRKLRPRPT